MLRVVAKNGYWETRGGDVPVFSDKERKMMVGFKKNWTFLFGEAPAGKRSIWSMSELRLNPRLIPTNQIQIGDNLKFKVQKHPSRRKQISLFEASQAKRKANLYCLI